MEYEPDDKYGKKIPYDPLWSGPLKVKRGPTDVPYIKAFGIYLLIWIAVALYAHSVRPPFDNIPNKGLSSSNDFFRTKRSSNDAEMIANEVASKIYVPLIYTASSGVIALLYVLAMRHHAKFIIFTVILLICLILFVSTAASTSKYLENTPETDAMLFPAITCGIALIIIVLAVVFLRRKIIIAAEVVREACKVVLFFPHLFVLPVVQFLLYAPVCGMAFYVYACTGIKAYSDGQKSFEFYLLLFMNSLGFYWTVNFIRAFIQITLSGSYATWFWTLNKRFVPEDTVAHTLSTIVRYHTGTLAFGSLILAICQMIREFFESIKHRCGPCIACCCQWYLETLERFLNYLNRNAYVMTAVHGTDFVQSAKDAFNLLMRNIVGVAVTTKVTRGVIFIGALLVLGVSATGTWIQCDGLTPHATFILLMFSILGSALLADAVFFLLDVAVDTIFLCVLEDYERNNGSEDRPYYMSSNLKTLFLK